MFRSTQQSTSDTSIQEQTVNCSRHLIQQYIENALHSGIKADKIKNEMEKLCSVFFVIPQQWLSWAMQEVNRICEKLEGELKISKPILKQKHQAPSLFSKDTLYHAGLCCEAINNVLSNPLSFFRNKKPHHSLTEVSFSQSRDGILPYLIARQKDVVYVAFQGIPEVSQWLKYTSFNEGNDCEGLVL